MHRSLKRTLVAVAVTALSVSSVAATTTVSHETEEPVLRPATELMYIAAGCPSDNGATCTSTRWLGLQPGDATSNYLTSTLPVDHVTYLADGSLNWRDYTSDTSWAAGGYVLRADEHVVATVELSATTGFALQAQVHGRMSLAFEDFRFETLGPLETTVDILPNSTVEVTFEFDVPDEWDGLVLESGSFDIALHGINVSGGRINQQGGSTVTLPHWVSEPAA